MANYHRLIAQTIAGIPNAPIEARRSAYRRARRVLLRQLHDARPPFGRSRIGRELNAFDKAIEEIEIGFAPRATPGPASEFEEAVATPHRDHGAVRQSAPEETHGIGDLRALAQLNSMKSILLIVGFPFLPSLIVFCGTLLLLLFVKAAQPFETARSASILVLAISLAGTLAWLPIACLAYQRILDWATGARPLARSDAPRAWRLLEDLCARCDMPVPVLRMIETDALNAYASGLGTSGCSITLTKGLIATLSDAELEAVIAHELTHIANRDTRLNMVAGVLVGFVPVGQALFARALWNCLAGIYELQERLLNACPIPGAATACRLSREAYGLVHILSSAILASVARVVSLFPDLLLSRRRKFLADAAALAITSDPEALISALRKISGRSHFDIALLNLHSILFDDPRADTRRCLLTSQPTIEQRIDALLNRADGSDGLDKPLAPRPGPPPLRTGDLMGFAPMLGALGTMSLLLVNPSLDLAAQQRFRAHAPVQSAAVAETLPRAYATARSLEAPPAVVAPGPAASPSGDAAFRGSPPKAEWTQIAQSPAASPPQPSFDCTKAIHRDEKLICKLPRLANLDVLTTQAFRQAHTANRAAALVAARSFIVARRACRNSVYCITGQQLAALEIYRSLGATVSDPP